MTRITLPTCRAHYPGGTERVHLSIASPSRAAFPGLPAGRLPQRTFRGLLGLHTRYGLLDRSTAQGGLCREAPTRPVTQPHRSPATRANRQLSGWILPPLVFRAVGAHGNQDICCQTTSISAQSRRNGPDRQRPRWTIRMDKSVFDSMMFAWRVSSKRSNDPSSGRRADPSRLTPHLSSFRLCRPNLRASTFAWSGCRREITASPAP